jgi:hypothetical protein
LKNVFVLGWHGIACLVFAFTLFVAFELTTGRLDPLGFAYYGLVLDLRIDVLLTLLAMLEALCFVDAIVLGRRYRRWRWWVALAIAVLVLPFSLVLSIARLDTWRYYQRSTSANVIAGALMITLIGAVFLLRRWAWRVNTTQESAGSGD